MEGNFFIQGMRDSHSEYRPTLPAENNPSMKKKEEERRHKFRIAGSLNNRKAGRTKARIMVKEQRRQEKIGGRKKKKGTSRLYKNGKHWKENGRLE